MIKINLNETCKVKLTEKGREVLLSRYGSFLTHEEAMLHASRQTDIYGYTKFPLWELFQTFGHEIHLGMSNSLFEDNDIGFN